MVRGPDGRRQGRRQCGRRGHTAHGAIGQHQHAGRMGDGGQVLLEPAVRAMLARVVTLPAKARFAAYTCGKRTIQGGVK